MGDLSHFDKTGASRMVDVGQKPISSRTAKASGRVRLQPATLERIFQRSLAKGDVLEVARLAGIMAAKRTSELIPLCHPLPLDAIELNFDRENDATLRMEAVVRCTGRTGVEMEALTAVAVAGLTIYDMCKSMDRSMELTAIRLEEKSGGQSGHYVRESQSPA